MQVQNKKALITGANGAIGMEIARTLHEVGHKLHLVGSGKAASELVALSQTFGADVSIIDFTEPWELKGDFDILINCAGIAIDNLFLRVTDDEWDRQIKVNLTTAWKLSKQVALFMCKQGWGRIISISSVIGHLGNVGQAAYAASKAGLFGMTRSLAREIASKGVTVNTVSPGFIKSPMTEKLMQDEVKSNRILANIPMGYFGEPVDVANAVKFLCSEGARYITGCDLIVSGGMLMD
jgi:3-oxoacyl-[acyl-carrier protein] reductase